MAQIKKKDLIAAKNLKRVRSQYPHCRRLKTLMYPRKERKLSNTTKLARRSGVIKYKRVSDIYHTCITLLADSFSPDGVTHGIVLIVQGLTWHYLSIHGAYRLEILNSI